MIFRKSKLFKNFGKIGFSLEKKDTLFVPHNRKIIENKFHLTKHADFLTWERISENGGTENYSMGETKRHVSVVLGRSGNKRGTNQRVLAAKKRYYSRYVHLASQKFDYVESLRCEASVTLFAEWPPNPFATVREGLSINPHFHSPSTRPKRKTEYERRKDGATWIPSSFRLQFAAWNTSTIPRVPSDYPRPRVFLLSQFLLSLSLSLFLSWSILHLLAEAVPFSGISCVRVRPDGNGTIAPPSSGPCDMHNAITDGVG